MFSSGQKNRTRRSRGRNQKHSAHAPTIIEPSDSAATVPTRTNGTKDVAEAQQATDALVDQFLKNLAPFQVNGNTSVRSGPFQAARGDVHDTYQLSTDPSILNEVHFVQRNIGRFKDVMRHAAWIKVSSQKDYEERYKGEAVRDPQVKITKKRKRSWKNKKKAKKRKVLPAIYYVEDILPGSATRILPDIGAYHVLRKVSDLKSHENDDYEGKDLVFYVERDGKIVIVAVKLGVMHRSKINYKKWQEIASVLEDALKIGRNNPRGDARGGVYECYVNFGIRKDGQVTEIDEYATRRDFELNKKKFKTIDEEIAHIKQGIYGLFLHLQKAANIFVPPVSSDAMNVLKEKLQLSKALVNGKAGFFTAMALATKYWSPLHSDNDFFYTILSCFCPSQMRERSFGNDILFRFCFPTLGFSVPMRTTDIMLFDSTFPHCTTNYQFEDARSFSLFTSEKTCCACLSNNNKKQLADANQIPDEGYIYSESVDVFDDDDSDISVIEV